MPTPPFDIDTARPAVELYWRKVSENPKTTVHEVAASLGMPRSTLGHWIARVSMEAAPPKRSTIEVAHVPDVDDIDELIAYRKRQFERKTAHEEASKLLDVRVKIAGPIGILHFGDPHVDDDGTDIAALEAHTDLCNRTEGLFAANVGDTTNNWTGRLAKLYAEQSTTAKQAWMLAEWFIKRCKWLYIIGGNHDGWSGAGDPINWIARGQTHIHSPSEARMALRFGSRTVIVNARHDHTGHSQWNPTHGPMKALQLGLRDHIAIAGHKHKSGYGVLKDPETGRTCHAIQVGSYKVYDRYAKDKGFRDQQLSPCVTTVIDPRLPDDHPDLVKVFWDPLEGSEYLTFLRKRKG